MIVYNISIKIHRSIEPEWISWQKEEHIPEIMSSGQFTEYRFYKLLEQDEQDDGITYVVQYFAPSLQHYQHYIDTMAPALRQKAFDKWGNRFIAFRSLMQVVN
jgi:hypothetical protein